LENTRRIELYSNLSKFYIKNVKPNLEAFDRARLIAQLSFAPYWFVAVTIIVCFFMYNPKNALFANLIGISVVSVILHQIIYYFVMKYVKRIDKKNSIHLYGENQKGFVFPSSADHLIKNILMNDFLKIFGDFKWCQSTINKDEQSQPEDKFKFIRSLKILTTPVINYDDFIWGKYKDVHIDIIEPDSSIIRPSWITAAITFFMYFLSFNTILIIAGGILEFIFPPSFILLAISGWLIVLFIQLCLLFVPVLLIFSLIRITTNCFRGILVTIDMNKDFKNHTFILERHNIKDNIQIDNNEFEEIKLEDIEFEKEYRAYSKLTESKVDTQIEARYLLTSAFLDRLKTIKENFGAEYVRAAFKDKKIVLAIHTGRDMFQIAGVKKITQETFVQLFNEIYSVLELVDTLKLDEKLGL